MNTYLNKTLALVKSCLDVSPPRYYTIKGKLTKVKTRDGVSNSVGVHPRLKAIGVEKIMVDFTNSQLEFIFEGNFYSH